jgi:hypothetical protein
MNFNRRKVSGKLEKQAKLEGLAPPQAQPMFLEVPDPVKTAAKLTCRVSDDE